MPGTFALLHDAQALIVNSVIPLLQVIYSFDEIGEPGFKEFERLALVNKICIKEKYLVGETGEVKTGEAEGVMGRILAATGTPAEVYVCVCVFGGRGRLER